MMQRLLRGRLLYLVMGLLVLFLYLQGAWLGPTESLDMGPPQPGAPPAVGWERALDAQTLKQAAVQQPRVALLLTAMTILVAAVGLVGLWLGLRSLVTGQWRSAWRIPRGRLAGWSFGELGRIMVLTFMMASLLPFARMALLAYQPTWEADRRFWLPFAMLVVDGFAILVILTFASWKGRSVWQAFGLSRETLGRSIAVGLQGYVMLFPWMLGLLFVVVEVARAVGYQPPMEPIHQLIFQERRAQILRLTVVLACVVGPVAEELFFRGVIYTAIRQRASRAVAMTASAALFALIHMNTLGFLPILVLGCLLADVYERTGSLAGPLVVHIVHNTFLMGLALSFRSIVSLA